MALARSLGAFVLVLVACACGGKSIDAGDGPSGGTDSGGTASGGTESGGTDSGGTESGGTDFGGTDFGGSAGFGGTGTAGTAMGGTGVGGSDPECTRYYDEAPTSVPVMIMNSTSKPLHLGPTEQKCATVPLFTVADANGQLLQEPDWCRFSCQNLHQHGGSGCPAVCPIWETVTLQPGESRMTTWSGQYDMGGVLPSSCVPFESPGTTFTCDQAKTIRPGMFTFRALAGTELECSLSSMCPGCTPDGQGGCKTTGTLISGQLQQAVVTDYVDPRYGFFEAPSPGDSNGAPPQRIIYLEFRE